MSTRDNSIKVEAKFMDKNTNFNSPFYNNQAMFVPQETLVNIISVSYDFFFKKKTDVIQQ